MLPQIDLTVPKPAPTGLARDTVMIPLIKPWELVLALICIATLVVLVPGAVQEPITVIVNCLDGKTLTMPSAEFDPEKFVEYCAI